MIQPVTLSDVLTAEVKPPHWLVQGMFPRGLLITLAGEPGAGKSMLSYTLSYCVAMGLPFLGYPTESTTVCYFDEENSQVDFQRYNQQIWHGLACPNVEQLAQRLHLYHFALGGPWLEEMTQVAMDKKPGLVVIDTATPVLNIQDENDNSEATRVIRLLRKVQRAADNDTTVLILKHERQRDEKGHRRTIRGAKAWLGAVDRTFYHIIPTGCRTRANGLRRTALLPDKLRSYGLEVPLGIEPRWTDEARKGLILQGNLNMKLRLPEDE